MSFTLTVLSIKHECKKRKKKDGPSKTLSYFDLHYGCLFDRIILNQNLKERNSKGFDINWLILRNWILYPYNCMRLLQGTTFLRYLFYHG